jgi:hypothetical protein
VRAHKQEEEKELERVKENRKRRTAYTNKNTDKR